MADLHALSNANPSGYRDMPPEGAAPNLSAFRLVDVREPDEYVGPLGHVPGSELVPMGEVLEAAAAWDRNQPTLLICRSGARSGRVAAVLTQMGFRHMYNLIGGMLVWNEAGLPVERP
jgi:rhodanese-related sulfurtransferase